MDVRASATPTSVEFQSPREGRVAIVLYDMLGKEVRTLFDGAAGAGVHRIEIDAAGLASGLYFYRMTADGFAETRKMMVLR